jgi:hypothetical protein
MTTQNLAGIYQGLEDYRGALIYTQLSGYKTVTMTISVATDEQSHVTSHAYNLPVSEEAEHLSGVDCYHFAVTDGTRIQLTIEAPVGSKEAWYTVRSGDIIPDHSPMEIDIIRSEESVPVEYAYTQEAFDEVLTYYADQIPHWLNETPSNDPAYDLSDFRR